MALVPLRIEAIAPNNRLLRNATGFLLTVRGTQFLVTCRHVVERTQTGEKPAYLRVFYPAVYTSNHLSDICIQVKLYEDPQGYREQLWIEHNDARDITLVPISIPPQSIAIDASSTDVDQHRAVIALGDDIVISGFPHGLSAQQTPIMKTGMLATEPSIPFDDKPIFLVDAQTRDGMSGAPVFQRRVGDWVPHGTPENIGIVIDASRPRIGYQFIGIYSGRVVPRGKKENQPEPLGFVWRRDAIEDMFP